MEEEKIIKINRELIRLFFLYGIIGGLSALLDFILFAVLYNSFTLNMFLANTLSVHAGIATSFLLNRKYNFKKEDKLLKRAVSFYLIGLFGLGLSQLILLAGNTTEIPPIFVKFCSIFLVASVQFVLNKVITFGKGY